MSVKIVAQKLNYDMSVPAETPFENNTPATAQGQSAATSGQSTPPQSPSVAPNTPPKYKSSSIAIKLSYNQPQSSQDKPSEPESGKQFSQVLSVPNPLERATPLTHSRSASSLAEVKKLNLPVTAGTCFMFVIFTSGVFTLCEIGIAGGTWTVMRTMSPGPVPVNLKCERFHPVSHTPFVLGPCLWFRPSVNILLKFFHVLQQ